MCIISNKNNICCTGNWNLYNLLQTGSLMIKQGIIYRSLKNGISGEKYKNTWILCVGTLVYLSQDGYSNI